MALITCTSETKNRDQIFADPSTIQPAHWELIKLLNKNSTVKQSAPSRSFKIKNWILNFPFIKWFSACISKKPETTPTLNVLAFVDPLVSPGLRVAPDPQEQISQDIVSQIRDHTGKEPLQEKLPNSNLIKSSEESTTIPFNDQKTTDLQEKTSNLEDIFKDIITQANTWANGQSSLESSTFSYSYNDQNQKQPIAQKTKKNLPVRFVSDEDNNKNSLLPNKKDEKSPENIHYDDASTPNDANFSESTHEENPPHNEEIFSEKTSYQNKNSETINTNEPILNDQQII